GVDGVGWKCGEGEREEGQRRERSSARLGGMVTWIPAPDHVRGRLCAGMTLLDASGGRVVVARAETTPTRNAIGLSSPVGVSVDRCVGRAKSVAFRPPVPFAGGSWGVCGRAREVERSATKRALPGDGPMQ